MSRPYIGGQAVLEGVMMRSPKSFVVAVRRPDGSIAVREQAWEALFPKLSFLRWPVFRGAVVLLESLHNGFSALSFSSEQTLSDEDRAKLANGSAGTRGAVLALASFAMVLMFIAAPHLLTYGAGRLLGVSWDARVPLFHVLDGVFRLGILLAYIWAISKSPEMKRVFEYHGAEHKAIWAYESQRSLTVDEARRFTTLHPRCGTSFLFVVVLVAVLLHIVMLPWLPPLSANPWISQLLMVLVKVPLAFPIAGVAYELQRFSAKERCPRWIQWLTRPGLWLQNITTREPSPEQLEIALLALGRALAREEGRSTVADGIQVYSSFSLAMAA